MKLFSTAAALLMLGICVPASLAQVPATPPVKPAALPPVKPMAAAHPEPGWLGVIIARGELREQIEATPILDRPYRPLHVYGNTVRRSYYRGAPGPRVRDVAVGAGAFVVGR